MTEIVKSYIGVGKVWARPFGTTGKLRHVGNVSVLNLKHKLNVQTQRDYTRTGGGTLVRVERLDAVECAMTWLTFSAENWAVAVAGVASAVAGGNAVAEVVKGYKDALVPLAFPPSVITTVTDSAALITYNPVVGGVGDYELSPGGLYLPATSTIVDAADLKVTYAYAAHTRLEGAMGTGSELQLFYEGLNEADSDKPVLVDLWRASVPSAEEVALIGTQLGEMKFAGELLKDGTKGSGVSAFYRARMT